MSTTTAAGNNTIGSAAFRHGLNVLDWVSRQATTYSGKAGEKRHDRVQQSTMSDPDILQAQAAGTAPKFFIPPRVQNPADVPKAVAAALRHSAENQAVSYQRRARRAGEIGTVARAISVEGKGGKSARELRQIYITEPRSKAREAYKATRNSAETRPQEAESDAPRTRFGHYWSKVVEHAATTLTDLEFGSATSEEPHAA